MWPASCKAMDIPIATANSTTPSTNVTLCSSTPGSSTQGCSLGAPNQFSGLAAQPLLGPAASPVFGGQHVVHRSRVRLPALRLTQHRFQRVDNPTEGDVTVQEGRHGLLIGGVEHRRNATARDTRR